MSKLATFTILGEPKGKGRPKFSKVGNFTKAYTPAPTVMYENLIATTYQQNNQPRFDDGDYVEIVIYAYYSIPQSKPKKVRDAMQTGEIRPIKKCDADNILKIVCDSLNGVAYRDDVQIMDAEIHRFYDELPRIDVMLRTCDAPAKGKPQGVKYKFGLE